MSVLNKCAFTDGEDGRDDDGGGAGMTATRRGSSEMPVGAGMRRRNSSSGQGGARVAVGSWALGGGGSVSLRDVGELERTETCREGAKSHTG